MVAKTTYGALMQNGTTPSPRSPQPAVGAMTLREATIQAHRTFKQDWRNEVEAGWWLVRMEKHVLATLGSRPVAEVTQEEILDVLEPLHASMPVTARRVRLNLRRVFAWAQARRLRVDNPAGDVLDGALPRRVPRSRHFRAPHYSEVAASISRVRSGSANPPTVWGFEMVAHTASRFNEVRGMRWAELDQSWTTWTIPAERSKDFREHRKPVTRQMRSVLTAAKEYQTMQGIATDLVICNRQGSPIGAGTVLKLLPRVPHRSLSPRPQKRLPLLGIGAGRTVGLRGDAAQSQPGQRGSGGLHPQRPAHPAGGDDAAVERLH